MRREEKREKMYFLQMSSKFFEEIAVKRLVLTGGNDALVIYLRIWCKSLETGGVIELTGMGMEPAEEIALMIDCPAVPQVASVLTMCQAYGLITVGEGDSGKIINFSLTEDYTRAWTREAIMRRNDKAARIEAAEAPAMIEEKPEESEEERKKREKKEAAKKREEDLARFLEAWKQTDMPQILKLTPDRKKSLLARIDDYGIDNMLKAVEIANDNKFLRGLVPPKPGEDPKKKPWKATVDFFCQARAVAKILEGNYDFSGTVSDAQPQKPKAPIVITDQMVDETIRQDGLTKANWNDKKAAYSVEMQAAIEAALI